MKAKGIKDAGVYSVEVVSSSESGALEHLKKENRKKSSEAAVFTGLVMLLIVVFFVSYLCVVEYDPMEFSLSYVVRIIRENMSAFGNWVMGNGPSLMINLKLRHYLTITLVGAALAGVGAMYKSIFRNVLAAPTTMGVQEGGILANMIFIAVFGTTETARTSLLTENPVVNSGIFTSLGQPLFIFAGCFFGVIAVWFIARTVGHGSLSSAAIILAGTVVNGAILGINNSVQYNLTMNANDDEIIQVLMRATLGSFDYTYRSMQLETMAITIIPAMFIMLFFTNKMNIFALGDEQAAGMGMNVNRFRWFVIILGAFIAGVTMVYCGHIAFVGFIVPQITMKLVGMDFRKQYVASVLLGGSFLLIVYDFADVFGFTDGLSVITTVIGGIMLIAMLLKKGGVNGIHS